MKEENKSFKEKWQDKKYQAKVKLLGYGIFVLLVIIMLSFGQGNNNIDNSEYNDIDENILEEDNVKFYKPNVDNYKYEIKIINEKDNNEEVVIYSGEINNGDEVLVKKINKKEYRYKVKNDKYYVLENDNYVLTSLENVYDIIEYKYIDIDNINNYLSVSEENDNEYYIYLKDVILECNIDEYFTILFDEDSLTIDYTNFINYLNDDDYDSYIVNFNYEV